MKRKFVLWILIFFWLPISAQYNIKKLMQEGRFQLSQGYYVTSMLLFERVVSVSPNLYEPWFLMAKAKYHLEDYAGAERDVAKAVALQPYIAEIFDLQGMILIRQKKFQNAAEAYSDAIKIDADNRDYWFNRAYCNYEVGDKERAISELKVILKRWQSFPKAETLYSKISGKVFQK